MAILEKKFGIALFFVLIVLGGGWLSIQLKFDHNRDRFFPVGNSDVGFMRTYFESAKDDDVNIFLAAEFAHSILNPSAVEDLRRIQIAMEQMEGVESVASVIQAKYPRKAGLFIYELPFISDSAGHRSADSLKIVEDNLIYGNLVASDFKSANFIINTVPLNSQLRTEAFLESIYSLERKFPHIEFHLAGLPVMQMEVVNKLGREMKLYILISFVLLLSILVLVYQSFKALIIPVLSVLGSMVIFFSYLSLTGQKLDVMSTLFPILLLIFTISDVIHLQTQYIEGLKKGLEPISALRSSIKEIGLALFLTSFTTAVGFASLATSGIEVIRIFGVNSAVGVMIAYGTVMFFSASGLLFLGKLHHSKLSVEGRMNWEIFMDKLYQWIQGHHNLIIASLFGTLVFSAWGISLISTNALLKGELPVNSQTRNDFEYFEQQFGGVRSFELAIIPSAGKNLLDYAVIKEVYKLERFLADSIGMNSLVSPATPFVRMNNVWYGCNNLGLPEKSTEFLRYKAYLTGSKPELLSAVITTNAEYGRMRARTKDRGSNIHEKENDRIRSWIEQNCDSNTVGFRITGTSLLYDSNHAYLRSSLFNSLGLAFIVVGLLFAILFLDLRMLWVSMVPNVVPLLVAAGVMGFLGIELQAITSIFFAISFGIAVDDTIHMLARYKLERKKGRTVSTAIRFTFKISGKAVILTSVVLVVSFSSLMFSDFKGTYYIGVLVSVTLISALMGDLLLLPLLLKGMNRRSIQRRRKKRAI